MTAIRYDNFITWWRKPVREVEGILHLCFWHRVAHHKARRPFFAVAGGVVVMVAGSALAHHAEAVEAVVGVNHLLVDTCGYFVHAAGAVPALRFVEPLWAVLMGVAAE